MFGRRDMYGELYVVSVHLPSATKPAIRNAVTTDGNSPDADWLKLLKEAPWAIPHELCRRHIYTINSMC